MKDEARTRLERALMLLQERLQAPGQTLAAAVEELCAQHPNLRDALQTLGRFYLTAQASAGSRPFHALVQEVLGEGETVTIVLEEENERATPPAPEGQIRVIRVIRGCLPQRTFSLRLGASAGKKEPEFILRCKVECVSGLSWLREREEFSRKDAKKTTRKQACGMLLSSQKSAGVSAPLFVSVH